MLAKCLPVTRFQRRFRICIFLEQNHPTIQTFHVKFTIDVNAFRSECGPKAIIDKTFLDVVLLQIVSRARLNFQEDLFAFDP